MVARSYGTTGIVTSIAAITALLFASSVAGPAFANVYNTGYSDQTTIVKDTAISGRHDFSDTTTTTPRSGWLASVFSTASFSSTGATSPTGWIHQQAVTLDDTTNNLEAWYNVWSTTGCAECPSTFQVIGTHGTGNSDVNFTYTLMTVDSTQVHYYYEPTTIGGSVTSVLVDYTKSSDSDPTNAFSLGTFTKSISGTNYKFKHFQFGVESNAVVTQTYKVKQYNMLVGTAGVVQSIPAKTAEADAGTDEINESWITYFGTSGRSKVACCDYTNANTDANSEDSTIPKGTLFWKKSTMTPAGTQLWT
jgi:hypothetical protein